MNVVVWGINYSPESTGIAPFNAELAEFLAERGHQVAMVTGFTYYPQWKKAPADRWRLFRREDLRGIAVHRCYLFLPGKVTTLTRIVHELSFVLSSFMKILLLPKADIYVVVSPPLALGLFAWIASRLKGSRYVFHVQDLQPDAAVGLGMLKQGLMVRLLYALERLAYRHAAAVSGISQGMIRAFASKGVEPARTILFPNWLRQPPAAPAAAGPTFRSAHQIASDAFVAVYSGNLGRKQGIGILLEAARLLADQAGADPAARRILLLIVGTGAARAELEAAMAEKPLPNLRLLPLLGDLEYAAMLRESDVGLITQAAGTGRFFFPSKLLTLLDAGLPVVTTADPESELAVAVAEGGFGLNALPDRPAELAAALRRLSTDPALRAELARLTHWVRRYQPELVLPLFARALEQLAAGKSAIALA